MNTIAPSRTPRPLSDAMLWREFLLIAVLFWTYVALSNVLYAHNFSVTLAATAADDLFAPWRQRALQHLLLLGPLVACFWVSLRVGWQPLWRTLPVQAALALGFAAIPHWAMSLAGWSIKLMTGASPKAATEPMKFEAANIALWIASGTSFLLQYGFGLALITGFALYQRYRDAELQVAALERQSNAARLSALRMQLSPHTLFNLLNTIRGQIGWDPQAAQQLVVQLSDLLRKLLNAGEREFSTLRDELHFVRLYLGLQQSRFADRITIDLPPADSLPALWVPSLILQPLVENAVAHGLAGHEGPVRIAVECSAGDERLILRVVNTIAPVAASGEEGIGLRNVRERLSVHFGDAAALMAGPVSGDQWQAQIVMPRVLSR